jgi:hypothetical protein
MGEIADEMILSLWDPDDGMGPPKPEDYLDMTDEELRKETSLSRSPKIMNIRKYPHNLTTKQRYCLACWLAERDAKYK